MLSQQAFCHHEQVQHPGDELNELEARQDPRLLRALDMVAPGTPLREGIDNIIHARTGGLIVVAEPDEVSYLFSGGLRLDVDYTPGLLYQVAKMDGAIVMPPSAEKIMWANVQLMPDPTILSMETGTRHRTAERVSKQTKALVIAISQRRDVVSLYVEGIKYILEDIPTVLSKANQGLATLEKYRARLDQVAGRLTALEFAGGVVLYDVLSVLQRAELVTRMATEVERYIIELGAEGRLIEMQLEDSVVGVMAERAALVRDYCAIDSEHDDRAGARPSSASSGTRSCSTSAGWPSCSATTARPTRSTSRSPRAATGRSRASRGCRGWWRRRSSTTSATSSRCSPPRTPTWRRSRGWGRPARRRSARASAGFRRSTSSTDTDEPDGRASGRLYLRRRTSQRQQ